MKKHLLTVRLVLCSIPVFSQADSWNPIITNGFGSPQNYNVQAFENFRDTLYATYGRVGAGQALMLRSGDGINWDTVNYSSNQNIKGIPSISADTIAGGYMWMATGNPTQGSQVFRTQNGTNWIPVSQPGFGNSLLWSPTPHMVLYQGTGDTTLYLYAAANSHGGPAKSVVMRTPYNNTNPSNWTMVVDFNIRDTNVTQVTYFYVWNNILYFGTNGDSLLYESADGVNFTANTGVATDFYGSDLLIACLTEFHGNLYAGTNNQVSGGQLYRTSDGNNWNRITNLLPNYVANVDEELHDMDTANGYLWVTPYTDTAFSATGMPVWRSTDSLVTTFVQSNLDGFGNPLTDGANPAVIGFNGREYFGAPNYSSGGQIWRTDLFTGLNNVIDTFFVTIFPIPFSELTTLRTNVMLENATLSIYNSCGQLVQEMNCISGQVITIYRNNLSEGLYFIQLSQNSKVILTEKLVITDQD